MEMGENDLVKLHVAAAHVNPGNWTYTEGWEPMLRAYSTRAVDEGGLDVDALPAKDVQLLYVTPSHQYPMGYTLSLGGACACSTGRTTAAPTFSKTTTTAISAIAARP
jgi:hypothetical protein